MRQKLPSLTALRAFEAVARLGGHTRAASELGVTHTAVVHQIRQLELSLARPLVKRVGNRLDLTETGRLLGQGLSGVFGDLHSLLAAIQDDHTVELVTVTTTPSFAAEWLLPRLPEFQAVRPSVRLEIRPSFDLLDLTAETIDLGIRFGPGTWPRLRADLIIPSTYVIVAATSLAGPDGALAMESVGDLPWIQELETREMVDWAERRGIPAPDRAAILSMPGNLILPAMRAGCGIARTARFLVAQDVVHGRVVVLDEEGAGNDRLGYHLVASDRRLNPAAQALSGWIKRATAADRALIATSS